MKFVVNFLKVKSFDEFCINSQTHRLKLLGLCHRFCFLRYNANSIFLHPFLELSFSSTTSVVGRHPPVKDPRGIARPDEELVVADVSLPIRWVKNIFHQIPES